MHWHGTSRTYLLLESCGSSDGASRILVGLLDHFWEMERVKAMQLHLGESDCLSRSCVISPSQSEDTFRDSLGKKMSTRQNCLASIPPPPPPSWVPTQWMENLPSLHSILDVNMLVSKILGYSEQQTALPGLLSSGLF